MDNNNFKNGEIKIKLLKEKFLGCNSYRRIFLISNGDKKFLLDNERNDGCDFLRCFNDENPNYDKSKNKLFEVSNDFDICNLSFKDTEIKNVSDSDFNAIYNILLEWRKRYPGNNHSNMFDLILLLKQNNISESDIGLNLSVDEIAKYAEEFENSNQDTDFSEHIFYVLYGCKGTTVFNNEIEYQDALRRDVLDRSPLGQLIIELDELKSTISWNAYLVNSKKEEIARLEDLLKQKIDELNNAQDTLSSAQERLSVAQNEYDNLTGTNKELVKKM